MEEVDDGVEARVVDAVDEVGDSGSARAAVCSIGEVALERASVGVEGAKVGDGEDMGLMEKKTFLSSCRASVMLEQ